MRGIVRGHFFKERLADVGKTEKSIICLSDQIVIKLFIGLICYQIWLT